MNTQQAHRERMLSVRETAQVLGLCLDSVRRHLRSGKMPGVRVGRNWRIPESQLSVYMGLITDEMPSREMPSHTMDLPTHLKEASYDSFQDGTYPTAPSRSSKAVKPKAANLEAATPKMDLLQSNHDVVEALFRTHPARTRILELVKEAASGADFSPEEAQHLLNELNDLLHQL